MTGEPWRARLLSTLIWIPLYFLIVLLLPSSDPEGALPRLRPRALFDAIFGKWDEAVADRHERQATLGQLFASFIEGDEALPARPEVTLPVVLGEVRDTTGGSDPWTRERLLAHPRSADFSYLRLLGSGSAEIPVVDLELTRDEQGIVVRCVGGSDGRVPLLRVRPRPDAGPAGEPLENPPLEGRLPFPRRTSMLPPLTAIFCALITRRAILSLLAGILAGGLVLGGGLLEGAGVAAGLYRAEITDQFRLSIVLFVLFLVGMVGVMTRAGGVQGLVELLTRRSRGARSTRIASALMGFLVFFDDYSNSVIVGSSMRPLTDRMRIAREKLAYLIDSTAAPVAGIAVVSTWIAYEVSQYQSALAIVDPASAPQAYSLFLRTIPFRFYCIFTLFFVLANVLLNRDYGPMRAAEERSASTGQVIRPGGQPLTSREFSDMRMRTGNTPRSSLAILPLLAVIHIMAIGFWLVGGGYPAFQEAGWSSLSMEGIGNILSSDYNMQVMTVAAVIGSLLAILLAVSRGALGLGESLRAWFVGFRSLFIAVAILFSAWAIAGACKELHTGEYLISILGEGIPVGLLPVAFFLVACVVAFATGTSWGTMAILLPISIPVVYDAEGVGLGPVTLLSFGAVLEGAIFGDHCSPISDTTVLSSVAAGSDHIDHVRTQIPYALTTMLLAMVVGYLPVAFGWYSSWVAIPLGGIACIAVLLLLGR
ncbi:MAG: Na+/H+ antiporter NhaC family protein, partial [Planctomycetota bacterium]